MYLVLIFFDEHFNSLTIETLVSVLCIRRAWQTVTKLPVPSTDDTEVKGFTLRLDTRQKVFLSKINKIGWSKQ